MPAAQVASAFLPPSSMSGSHRGNFIHVQSPRCEGVRIELELPDSAGRTKCQMGTAPRPHHRCRPASGGQQGLPYHLEHFPEEADGVQQVRGKGCAAGVVDTLTQ